MKGIIAEIKGKKAVLLTTDGAFELIANKNYTIGQKVEHKASHPYKQLIAVAACFFLLMCAGFTGYALYITPTSYVSIDINPSVELDINLFHKVISVKPLNNDAKNLLKFVHVENQDTGESLSNLIKTAKSMGYLNNHNKYVIIDLATKENRFVSNITDELKKYESDNIHVLVERSSSNELAESQNLGISMGRLKALKDYSRTFGGNVKGNASHLSGISVGNLKQMIKEKDNSSQIKESPKSGEMELKNNQNSNKTDNNLASQVSDNKKPKSDSARKNRPESKNDVSILSTPPIVTDIEKPSEDSIISKSKKISSESNKNKKTTNSNNNRKITKETKDNSKSTNDPNFESQSSNKPNKSNNQKSEDNQTSNNGNNLSKKSEKSSGTEDNNSSHNKSSGETDTSSSKENASSISSNNKSEETSNKNSNANSKSSSDSSKRSESTSSDSGSSSLNSNSSDNSRSSSTSGNSSDSGRSSSSGSNSSDSSRSSSSSDSTSSGSGSGRGGNSEHSGGSGNSGHSKK